MNEKLRIKLEQEMKEFKEKIKENGVDFAIDKAYELTVKQEIIDCINYDKKITKQEEKILTNKECLLDELYSDWIGFDGNMRDNIEYSLDKSVDLISKDYKNLQKKTKKYER